MTGAQARVIDPILSHHLQGYLHPARVGAKLFPRVPVQVAGGRVLEFDRESFRLVGTRRAPGTAFKRVQYGHFGKPYALENRGLEGVVADEIRRDAAGVPGVDLAKRSTQGVLDQITLDEEYGQAQLALNAANYANTHKLTLAGSDQWSHADARPAQQIRSAGEAIRGATGLRPNLLLLGAKPYASLQENPSIIERIKYTGRDTVTAEILANLFDVNEVVVGDSVYLDDTTDTFVDIWGDNAVLAYVAPGADRSMETPSYAYTYTMEGHPAVTEPYYERNVASWVYPVLLESVPVLTGAAAGFLFIACSGA